MNFYLEAWYNPKMNLIKFYSHFTKVTSNTTSYTRLFTLKRPNNKEFVNPGPNGGPVIIVNYSSNTLSTTSVLLGRWGMDSSKQMYIYIEKDTNNIISNTDKYGIMDFFPNPKPI